MAEHDLATIRYPRVILSVLYGLAYLPMLFNRGVVGEGLLWFRGDWHLVEALIRQNGVFPPWTWLWAWTWSSTNTLWATRVAVFLAYLAVGLLTREILITIPSISPRARFYLVGLELLFSAANSRAMGVASQYGFGLALFALGFWLMTRYLDGRVLIWRLLALVAFALSFRTASLLVFYALVLLYVLWRSRVQWSARSLSAWALANFDLILLPVVCWVFQRTLFAPYGTWAGGYHVVTLEGLLHALRALPAGLWMGFFEVVGWAFTTEGPLEWVALPVLSILLWLVLRAAVERPGASLIQVRTLKTDLTLMSLGFAMVALGIYPYLAVGSVPALESATRLERDFASHHQVLVPFGAAMILYYVTTAVFRGKKRGALAAQSLALAVLLAAFGLTDFVAQVAYVKGGFKNAAIVEQFRKSPILRDNTTFVVVYRAEALRARPKVFAHWYEYSGLMKEAFGTETRFAIDEREKNYGRLGDMWTVDFSKFRGRFTGYWKTGGYRERPIQYAVIIEPGSTRPDDPGTFLRLLWLDWTDHARFHEEVGHLLTLRYMPAPATLSLGPGCGEGRDMRAMAEVPRERASRRPEVI
jgi:hypothetical protein